MTTLPPDVRFLVRCFVIDACLLSIAGLIVGIRRPFRTFRTDPPQGESPWLD